jgi:hypothetical protein
MKKPKMKRDEQIVEAELMEISAIQDDTIKLERIVAWCANYPDEVPFALRFFRARSRERRKPPIGNSAETEPEA